jgi:hypothetical protein
LRLQEWCRFAARPDCRSRRREGRAPAASGLYSSEQSSRRSRLRPPARARPLSISKVGTWACSTLEALSADQSTCLRSSWRDGRCSDQFAVANSSCPANWTWRRSTRKEAELQAHGLTIPRPASTPRACLQRSLAALGRLAWLEVLVPMSLTPERCPAPARPITPMVKNSLQSAHISVSRLCSSSCSMNRIEGRSWSRLGQIGGELSVGLLNRSPEPCLAGGRKT